MTVGRGVLSTTALITVSVALTGPAAQGVQARPGSSAPVAAPTRAVRAAALPATFVGIHPIPCPAALRRCQTRAGEYGPDERLGFVASTTGRGAKADLAYYSRGRSYLTTTRLPKASRFVNASAARSGALIVSGAASVTATRSDDVASWDGRTLRRHTTAGIEPSW